MGSTLYKNDSNIIIEYMKSYLKSKPPDCTLFSKDGFEIPVHKELIYQTKLIPQIIKSGTACCCSNIDIIFSSIDKKQLEVMVQFLYDGQIFCPDPITATEVISNLKEFFGVPDLMDIVETSSVQVNLCQKGLFLHQLTHNFIIDCSLIYQFSTWKLQAPNMLCTQIVFCFYSDVYRVNH